MTAQTIVYFGDSLTDNNNLFTIGEGILPDEIREDIAGPTGAVSNGPTHAAYTTDLLGAEEANFAVAAAEALGTFTLRDLAIENGFEDQLLVPIDDPALDFDINFDAQIDRFLAESAGEDLSHTTGFILVGANDFNNIDFDSPSLIEDAFNLVEDIIAAQVAAALELFDAGMGTVWLSELPVAEFFTATSALSELESIAANQTFDIFNNRLADAVDDLADGGFDARLMPLSEVTNAIVEDPTGFGFLAPYTDTLTESNALDIFDEDQIAAFDSIHPTTATHGVIGAFNAHVLDGKSTVVQNDVSNALSLGIARGDTSVVFMNGGDDLLDARFALGKLIGFGGTGNDSISGWRADDLISGGAGDDSLSGFAGDDVINVGLGNDVAKGMRGFDLLIDSLGDDFLRGGRDDDIFVFTDASLLGGTDNGTNIIVGGEGYDILYLIVEDVAPGTDTDQLAADLGLRVRTVEEIIVLDGREALRDFEGDPVFDEADIWGLI